MVAGIFMLVYPQKYVLATCFSGIDIVDTKGFTIPTVETGGLHSPLNPTICQLYVSHPANETALSSTCECMIYLILDNCIISKPKYPIKGNFMPRMEKPIYSSTGTINYDNK
jgi:hypothetical protein